MKPILTDNPIFPYAWFRKDGDEPETGGQSHWITPAKFAALTGAGLTLRLMGIAFYATEEDALAAVR